MMEQSEFYNRGERRSAYLLVVKNLKGLCVP